VTEVATELFHDQGGFDKKLKLTNYMVLHRGRLQEITSWTAVYSRLQAETPRAIRVPDGLPGCDRDGARLLMAADDKAGYPRASLEHAVRILAKA
jgi:hypothetical protein